MANPLNQQLETALNNYAATLPRQARLIHLAGEVLRQLAQVRGALPPAPAVDLEKAAVSLAAGEPVLTQVQVAASIFRATLGRLLKLFQEAELLPPLPPDLLHQMLSLSPQVWLHQTTPAPEIIQTPEVPTGLIFFLARQALSPFYQQAAAPYAAFFLQSDWQQGICPGCGQEPALSALAPDSGQRLLYCNLCAVQWPFPRLACPFCSLAHPKVSYIFAEDDLARRADLCQNCRRYLKTIIPERLKHPLFLPLEEFVTVDLDTLLARPDLIS